MALLKPMLAAEADLEQIQYPVYASPKLDGIRATVQGGVLLSRTLKPIPNKYVQSFDWSACEGFDGELIVGSADSPDVYRNTVSGIMSQDGTPDFTFWVFDNILHPGDYKQRRDSLPVNPMPVRVWKLPQQTLLDESDLLAYEGKMLSLGYEGIILRRPSSPYKHGRSTVKQGYLLKLKRFEDSEGEIVGFKELMHNANEAKINELGYQERSHKKEGMVPTGTLGAFIIKDLKTGVENDVGTGFTLAERQAFWKDKESLMGKIVKYKYFPIGVKEKPRHPVFLGFRDPIDLGEQR